LSANTSSFLTSGSIATGFIKNINSTSVTTPPNPQTNTAISSNVATVCGSYTTAIASQCTTLCGSYNAAIAMGGTTFSSIYGGVVNSVLSAGSTNTIYGSCSSIIAGNGNEINGAGNVIVSSYSSTSCISSTYSFISSSYNSFVCATSYGSILSASDSCIRGSSYSSLLGTNSSAICFAARSSIIGGNNNQLRGTGNSILGSIFSNITGTYTCNSAIIGGSGNCITGINSVILGGSAIIANCPNTAYSNNFCSFNGKYYGDGSALTGLATGSFITTGQTGVFALSANTGSFVTTAQTGVFALSANTGSFVTTGQTGVFLSNSGNKILIGGTFTAASGFVACNGRYYNDQNYGYVIVGDGSNLITSSSPGNSIFGGAGNSISSTQIYSTIVGGRYNSISSATSDHSVILGGCYNSISNSAVASVVAGGGTNYICCTFGFIGGGCCNHLRACNSVILGSCRVTGTASFTTYVTNLCSIGGYISVGAIEENITTYTSGASGLINFDVCSAATMYYIGNSTANFYLNLRSNSSTTLNSILEVSKTLTVTFLNTNGSTAYPLTGIAIDGTGRSIKWLNGTGSYPAGNTGSIDTYSITAVKTGDNLYTVLGSQGKFV
jgi:hypothetical protein